MQTRPQAERGFTLFEMLLVMVIIGVVTAVGFSLSMFQTDSLDKGTQLVMRQVSEGRSRAILLRKPVTMYIDSQKLRLLPEGLGASQTLREGVASGESFPEGGESGEPLPEDVRVISVNTFPPDTEHAKLVFHPFGIVRESTIHMEQSGRSGQVRQCTVYVPSVGAPRVLSGHQDIDSIMKELL